MSNTESASVPAPLRGAVLWIATACASLANFVVALDATIANVSVPHIAGALAVSPSQGTWVITSYAVSEAVSVPLTGWLAQRFGVFKLFLGAIIGFGIASAICGLAPTFGILVASRVLQGMCGGPLMPMSQTLMLRIFPFEQRQQGLAVWSMTTVAGTILGPILGGVISDNLGWSWIFFINVPVAIAVVLGARFSLRSQDAPGQRVPIDYVGLAMLVVWVGSLQIMLDKGKSLEWFSSSTIVALALIAAIGFCAFLVWELTAENPIVNLRIFRYRGFAGAAVANSIAFGTYFSSIVLIPLWLQTGMGYTATAAGNVAAVNGCLGIVAAPIVARLMRRIDARVLVSFGLFSLAAVAWWRSHFTTDATYMDVLLPYVAAGISVPFFFVPMTVLSFSSVRADEIPSAAGLQNFMRTTAGAFGTSIMTTFWENDAQARRYELAARMHEAPAAATMLQTHGLTAAQAAGQLERLLQSQAVMVATDQTFLAMVFAFGLAGACVWIVPNPKRAQPVVEADPAEVAAEPALEPA